MYLTRVKQKVGSTPIQLKTISLIQEIYSIQMKMLQPLALAVVVADDPRRIPIPLPAVVDRIIVNKCKLLVATSAGFIDGYYKKTLNIMLVT